MPALRAPLRAPIEWPADFVKAKARSVTDSTSRYSAWERAVLVGILLLSVSVRLINLGHSYWGDEDATVRLLQGSFWHMLRHGIPGGESTPPLYYVIAWGWSRVFGTTEFAVRSLTALIGVTTVVVAFAIGFELRSKRGSLILAALVAASPFMVWFSQNARAYVLVILLTSVGLLFFLQALRTKSSKSIWLWAVASAAALSAHHFAIFVVVPEAVALLVSRSTRSRAIRPTAFVTAIWLALLPLLVFQSTHNLTSWITYLGLTQRLKMTLQFFSTASWGVSFLVLAALAALGAVVIGSTFAAHRIHRRELLLLCVGATAILVPTAAALVGFDYANYQNFVVAWMPFAAVFAAALASWRRVGAVFAVVLFGLALAATVKVQTTATLQRPDWRLAAEKLSAQPANSLIVEYPGFDATALRWYDGQLSIIGDDAFISPDRPLEIVRTRRLVIFAEDPWVYSAANTLRFPVPAGFRETSRTSFSTFVMVTYSAPHAVTLSVNRLAAMRPSGYLLATTPWTSTVFFQGHAAPR
jgi:mannosyltransferase